MNDDLREYTPPTVDVEPNAAGVGLVVVAVLAAGLYVVAGTVAGVGLAVEAGIAVHAAVAAYTEVYS